MFLNVTGTDSIYSKLLKTVGLLAVRLVLTKLRLKNHEKMSIFDQNLNLKKTDVPPYKKCENGSKNKCSPFLTKKLNPKKKPMYPLIKNAKMGKKRMFLNVTGTVRLDLAEIPSEKS